MARQLRTAATAGEGILDDYACLADGLLELFLATGTARWLVRRPRTGRRGARPLRAPGRRLVPDRRAAPRRRWAARIELFDSVVPSGNAVLLQVLLKLAALTGETIYADEAAAALTARAGLLERGGLDVAGWLAGRRAGADGRRSRWSWRAMRTMPPPSR